MLSSKGIKIVAVLAFVGIFVVGLTTAGIAQQFGQKMGPQGSQPSGDLSKNTQGQEGATKPAPAFGVKVGPQGSQPSGDMATNTAGPAGSAKPASSFGVKVGPQGSQPAGDMATNSAKPQ